METAKEIFDLMAKFADYGFNRSHSVAYAYLAFQTGYLKAHYPTYFYASVLSHESDDSAKVYMRSKALVLRLFVRLSKPGSRGSSVPFLILHRESTQDRSIGVVLRV
jgi:DNA polymerase-3 subunit alpha